MNRTIVFCAGAANPDLSLLQHIRPHLLIGADGGAAALAAAGHIPDWAIGDFDSAPPPASARNILRLPAEKDDTDLEAALLHILPQQPADSVKEIIILGAAGGGRLDHLLANIWLVQQPRFAAWADKIRLHEHGSSARFYRAGSHHVQPETDKQYISFIGMTPIAQLTLRGVKYPLHCRDFAYPPALVSNESTGGEIAFSFADGLLCLIQSSDSAA